MPITEPATTFAGAGDSGSALREERNKLALEVARLRQDNQNYDRLLARSGIQLDSLQKRLKVQEQRVDELRSVFSDLISAVRSINRSPQYEVRVTGDDEPQYRQRKEWVDWILELCDEATTALNPTAETEIHEA